MQSGDGKALGSLSKLYLPTAPGLYLPGNPRVPGHQLNELALPMDAYQAHILLYTRQLQYAPSSTCHEHN